MIRFSRTFLIYELEGCSKTKRRKAVRSFQDLSLARDSHRALRLHFTETHKIRAGPSPPYGVPAPAGPPVSPNAPDANAASPADALRSAPRLSIPHASGPELA